MIFFSFVLSFFRWGVVLNALFKLNIFFQKAMFILQRTEILNNRSISIIYKIIVFLCSDFFTTHSSMISKTFILRLKYSCQNPSLLMFVKETMVVILLDINNVIAAWVSKGKYCMHVADDLPIIQIYYIQEDPIIPIVYI